MWFKKRAVPAPPPPGAPRILSGLRAVLAAETSAGAAPEIATAHDANDVLARVVGRSMAGLRSAAVLRDAFSVPAAATRLPFVLHLMGTAAPDLLGAFQLAPKNGQEAADFALIAHRIAELALRPGICIHDDATARSAERVWLPSPAPFLGNADDEIDSPTPAQVLVLGKKRRRVPAWIDLDRPAGIGARREGRDPLHAAAAERAFFSSHVAEAADRAMREFRAYAGRDYARATGYHTGDAAFVVVAHGSIVEELEAIVDVLRETERTRVGVLNLTMPRPFPADLVARMLRGKLAVTVLEQADSPLHEAPPLLREIRGALPESDRPRLLSGIYHSKRTSGELRAVIRNMVAERKGRKLFFLGTRFEDAGTRFPMLEALQHRILRDYPEANGLSLPAGDDRPPLAPHLHALRIHSVGAGSAGELLAVALAEAAGWNVRTWSEEDASRNTVCTMVWSDREGRIRSPGARTETAIVANPSLITEEVVASIVEGGLLFVESDPEAPPSYSRCARAILRRRIVVMAVPAVPNAPCFASVGAFLRAFSLDLERLRPAFREELGRTLGDRPRLVDEAVGAVERGGSAARRVPEEAFREPGPGEPTAPWPIRNLPSSTGDAFDPVRFWISGEARPALADPFAASGLVPNRSSAGRDLAPARSRIPALSPERCTGCGSCWVLCPDSALAPSLHPLATYLSTAAGIAGGEGDAPLLLPRASESIARTAERLLAKDELRRYLTLGPLFTDAFDQVADRMGLSEEKLGALRREWDRVLPILGHFPIVRTERGGALSISLNPRSCTECRLCVQECPEKALEMKPQTAEVLAAARRNWEFFTQLPEVAPERTDAEQAAAAFFDRRIQFALIGGDSAPAGSGAKTALRLAAAAAESVMKPRIREHVERLTLLIRRLEEALREGVLDGLRVNDFDGFARRLDRLAEKNDPAALIEDGIDSERLRRISRLREALVEQHRRCTGRACVAMTFDASTAAVSPCNPFAFPWAAHRPEHAAGIAAGLFEGLRARMETERRILQEAENALGTSSQGGNPEPMPPLVLVLDDRSAVADGILRLLRGAPPVKIVVLNSLHGAPAARDFGLLGLLQGDVFVLQSTIAHPEHLFAGLREGLASPRPALFHVYAPDPQAHGIAPDRICEQARLVCAGRVFPLFVFRPDRGLSLEGNPSPDGDWDESSRTFADWAVHEARFGVHFERRGKGDRHGGDVSVAQAVAEAGGRVNAVLETEEGRFAVSPAVVRAAEERLAIWRFLRRLAAPRQEPPPVPVAKEEPRLREVLTGRLLSLCGLAGDDDASRATLREFVDRLGRG